MALRAAALIVPAALVAACGHRSVQIIEGCEDLAAPTCQCDVEVTAPICVDLTWQCPACLGPKPDAMPATRDAGAPLDASPPADARAADDAAHTDDAGPDAREPCADGDALVCRRGCGHRTREWRPTCEGTTWVCGWGGTLEDQSTPVRVCDGGT